VLTWTLERRDSSHSRLGRFNPSTHLIEGWVGPRAGLDAVEERIFLAPAGDLVTTPMHLRPYLTELSRICI
jgi:hypothetical protein